MRIGLVLTTLLLACPPICGQTTPPIRKASPIQSASDPETEKKLDGYLRRWEQEMEKVQTLAAQLKRITKDKTFDNTTNLVGYAQYMKAGTGASALHLASLSLYPKGSRQFREKFVCTGTFLYNFLPAQKEVRVYEVPKKSRAGDSNFLTFLVGIKADEARRRYILKLVKEDKWYIYISVTPRFRNDKADFQKARLVLNKDSFLPRQVWFESTNGDEVTWDIPRIQSGVRLDRRQFDRPRVPKGWKLKRMPRPDAAQPAREKSDPGKP